MEPIGKKRWAIAEDVGEDAEVRMTQHDPQLALLSARAHYARAAGDAAVTRRAPPGS